MACRNRVTVSLRITSEAVERYGGIVNALARCKSTAESVGKTEFRKSVQQSATWRVYRVALFFDSQRVHFSERLTVSWPRRVAALVTAGVVALFRPARRHQRRRHRVPGARLDRSPVTTWPEVHVVGVDVRQAAVDSPEVGGGVRHRQHWKPAAVRFQMRSVLDIQATREQLLFKRPSFFSERSVIITVNVHTLNHKKRDILFLTITLANLDRFL